MIVTSAPPSVEFTRTRAARLGYGVTIAAIVWGALAFGAVYPWAYWPLAVAAQASGFLGLFTRHRAVAGMSRQTAVALVVLAAAPLVQVVPLSRVSLQTISSATVETLDRVDLTFAVTGSHSLSIHPSSTWIGLALFSSLALLAAGTSRLVSVIGPAKFIDSVAVTGGLLALIGIIQKPLFAGKIYGFWTPELGGNPFGPFVNKNHFAGWMLMAIPLALGLLLARMAREMRDVRPHWRARLLWLSSPGANKLILLTGAVAVMALALMLTMSRSGITALALALTLTSWFVLRGRGTVPARITALAFLALLAVALVGWVGADLISARFMEADWQSLNARTGAWADARSIALRFPLFGTGLNTYHLATLVYQQHDLTVHYAQAHSDYLQLAAEGGLLLTIPAAVCVAFFIRDIRRRFREDAGSSAYWIRAGAATALVAIGLQETVEFSLQMPGNAVFFAVVCGIALHKAPGRRLSTSNPRVFR